MCRAKQFPIGAFKVLGAFNMRSKNSARTELTKYNKKVNFLFLFRSAPLSKSEHEQKQTKPAILFNYFVVFPHARVVEMRMNMKNFPISTDRKYLTNPKKFCT